MFRPVCSGCSSLLHVHPDFATSPRVRNVTEAGTGQRFGLSLLLLTALCHPWPGHSCFPYPWPPIAFRSLQHLAEATFKSWLPRSVWSYVPWRYSHVSDWWDVSDLPGACGLWTTTWITTLWQPDLDILVCPPRLGCRPGCWGDARVQASQRAFACLTAPIGAPERCNLGKEPLLWGRRRVETPCAAASLRHWGSFTKTEYFGFDIYFSRENKKSPSVASIAPSVVSAPRRCCCAKCRGFGDSKSSQMERNCTKTELSILLLRFSASQMYLPNTQKMPMT